MRPVKKTPPDQLSGLISEHMSAPGYAPRPASEGDFVISAIRAAHRSSPRARRKILSDVADVLNCVVADLSFLFDEFEMPQTNVVTYEVMVPDFQSRLYAAAE